MPCYDGRDNSYSYEYEYKTATRKVEEQQKKIDKLTDFLCEACSKLKSEDLSPELKDWHNRHTGQDRLRVATEFSDIVNSADAKTLRQIQELLDNLKKEKNK